MSTSEIVPSFSSAALISPSVERVAWPTLLLGLATFTGVLCDSSGLLSDPDTQWHVAIGRWMLSMQAVPWTDERSHSFAGAFWIAKEWLSQLAFALAFEADGWRGVSVVGALLIAVSWAALFAWLALLLRGSVAFAISAVVALLCIPHSLARPHLFSYPILLVWTAGLFGAAEQKRAPSAWLVLAMALWANLHASFPFGWAMAAFAALEALATVSRAERPDAARRWLGFVLLVCLVSFATPDFFRPLLVPLTLFGAENARPFIIEWQPLSFGLLGGIAVLALALSSLLLGLDGRRSFARLGLVLVCGAMMIRYARFLDVFAIITAVLVAAPLLRRFPKLAAGEMTARDVVVPRRLVAATTCLLAGTALAVAASVKVEPPQETHPAAALAAARRLGLTDGIVYNDYKFGGFLIAEGVKTFVDGRSDQLFTGPFMTRLRDGLDGRDDLVAFARSFGVTWALVAPGSPEARQFVAAGWQRPYADASALLFRAP